MSVLFGATTPLAVPGDEIAQLLGRPLTLRRVRCGAIEVWAAAEAPRGFGGLAVERDGRLVAGCGDRIAGREADFDGAIAWSALTQLEREMVRFAFVHATEERLVLGTDWMAGWPLYYGFDRDGALLFATEAKILVGLLPHARRMQALDGPRPLPPAGETLFHGVHAVPPGTLMSFLRRGPRWALEATTAHFALPRHPRRVDGEAARVAVAAALERSVSRATLGHGRVAVALSGGLDSAAVAALARPRVAELDVFTVGTAYASEYAPARELATRLDARHHALTMNEDDLRALLPDLIWRLETIDLETLERAAPLAHLYRRAGGALLLTGSGADALFAGAPGEALDEEAIEAQVVRRVLERVPSNLFHPALPAGEEITVRHPFWSRELMTLALDLRGRLKVREGVGKLVLRGAMTPLVGAELAGRDKCDIHEGARVGELFAAVLGSRSRVEQAREVRVMAERLFVAPFTDSAFTPWQPPHQER